MNLNLQVFVAVVPLLLLGGFPMAMAEEQSLTPAAEPGDLSPSTSTTSISSWAIGAYTTASCGRSRAEAGPSSKDIAVNVP